MKKKLKKRISKMKKIKIMGFTLIELLVTLAILGIITGLSIPIIRNVQTQQTNRKYTVYLDSLSYATKLYTDSYAQDLFGYDIKSCAYVTYKDLDRRHLIKDIDIKELSCDSEYTVVKVVKFEEKYFYTPYIGCGSKTGNKVNPTIFKPSKFEISAVCDSGFSGNIVITAVHTSDTTKTKRKVVPQVKIVSESGVNSAVDQPIIDYAFVNPGRSLRIDEFTMEDLKLIGSWQRLNFDIFSQAEQRKLIKMGKPQIFNEKNGHISTPADVTGEIWLAIRVTALNDLNGSPWSKVDPSNEITNYVFMGPYILDNKEPDFGTSTVISSATGYNSRRPKLKLNAHDVGYSEESDLKVCYSYDNEPACPKPAKVSDLNELDEYKSYSSMKNAKLKAFSENYTTTQKNHTVKVTIVDGAGNYATKNFNYTVDAAHTLTFDADGGSCAVSKINQLKGKQWSDPIASAEDYFKDRNFCTTTKTGYTVDGWYTAKNGGGTQVTGSSVANSNITVYPKWKAKTSTVTFDCNGGTGGGTQTFTYGVANQKFTTSCSKTGYKLDGWKESKNGDSQYSVNSGVTNAWINGHSPTTTLYAHWVPLATTVTFDCNEGTGGGTQTFTYDKANQYFNTSCSRSGYTLLGWKDSKNGTSAVYTVSSGVTNDWINGHVPSTKVYAHWGARTYTVSYAGGGATGGSTGSTSCTYGQAITTATNGFSRTGYTFAGWAGKPATCTGDVTLTASWTANTYYVSYSAGDGGTGYMAQTTCTYGETISTGTFGFSKAHYHFNGWAGSTTCSTSNTLTATWAPNTVTIRYHTGTSSGSELRYKPAGWSIQNNYQLWNATSQDVHIVAYGNVVNLINHHNSNYVWIKKTSSSNGTAKANKEWERCSGDIGANCVKATYNEDTDYSTESICDTTYGSCKCCLRVNWQ